MQNDLTEGSLNTLSLAFAEGLYADYLKDPSLVSEDWQEYFAGLTPDAEFSREPQLGPTFRTATLFNPPSTSSGHGNGSTNGAVTAKSNGNGHAAPAWGNGVSEVAVRQDRVDA